MQPEDKKNVLINRVSFMTEDQIQLMLKKIKELTNCEKS